MLKLFRHRWLDYVAYGAAISLVVGIVILLAVTRVLPVELVLPVAVCGAIAMPLQRWWGRRRDRQIRAASRADRSEAP